MSCPPSATSIRFVKVPSGTTLLRDLRIDPNLKEHWRRKSKKLHCANKINISTQIQIEVPPLSFCNDQGRSDLLIVATAAAGASLLVGQPLYIDPATGFLFPANANSQSTAAVLGLSFENYTIGTQATVIIGGFELENWTAIVGTVNLQVGQSYFLNTTAGTLIAIDPTLIGAASAVFVGIAISSTLLDVRPAYPIVL